MKRIFFTIFLVAMSCNNILGQNVTKEEYEIYAIVLEKIYFDNAKIFANKDTEFIFLKNTPHLIQNKQTYLT